MRSRKVATRARALTLGCVIALLALFDLCLGAILVQKLQASRGASFSSGGGDPDGAGALGRIIPSQEVRGGVGVGREPEPRPWAWVESPDLRTHVARLRRAGCPEPVLRDIITAEVNRRFAKRERALKGRGRDCEPWEAPPSHPLLILELRRKARSLFREKNALLEDLLGYEAPADMPAFARRPEEEEYESVYEELPPGKRDRIRAIQESYWEKLDDLEWSAASAMDAGEEALELDRLEAQRREALSAVLMPSELETFDMATSSTARLLSSITEGFDASEEELRAMFRALREIEEEFEGDPADALDERFRVLLGEERYLYFRRSRTPVFRVLAQICEESRLPRERALRAYEIQVAALEKASHLKSEASLSDAERQEALDSLRTEAEHALDDVLGADAFRKFQQSQHWAFRRGEGRQ